MVMSAITFAIAGSSQLQRPYRRAYKAARFVASPARRLGEGWVRRATSLTGVDHCCDRLRRTCATHGATMTANPTSTTQSSLGFPPVSPTVAIPPTEIAKDTWVIHQ